MISFAPEDDQQIAMDLSRKFAAEAIRPHLRAWEQAGAVAPEGQAAFDALGLCALDLPESPAFGNADEAARRMTTLCLVHEELAFGDAGAAVALWAPHGATHAVAELADREQWDRLLPPLVHGPADSAGPLRGAVAYSERVPTGLFAGFSTLAVPQRNGYALSGRKSFVVNAGLADLTLVFAQINPDAGWDGFGVFAVTGRPGRREGMRVGERHGLLGLDTVTVGELIFEECFVPEEDRLRGGGAIGAAVQRYLARVQLVGAARQVGLSRAAYEYALSYTQDRRAFGKPVAHFQAIAFTLADMLMDVEAARWLLWRAAAVVDRGPLDRAACSLCAQAAAHANEAAWRTADNAVQLLGGAGYIQDFPVEKWLRDTRVLSLLSGADPLHHEFIAEAELGIPPTSLAGGLSYGLPGAALQAVLS